MSNLYDENLESKYINYNPSQMLNQKYKVLMKVIIIINKIQYHFSYMSYTDLFPD